MSAINVLGCYAGEGTAAVSAFRPVNRGRSSEEPETEWQRKLAVKDDVNGHVIAEALRAPFLPFRRQTKASFAQIYRKVARFDGQNDHQKKPRSKDPNESPPRSIQSADVSCHEKKKKKKKKQSKVLPGYAQTVGPVLFLRLLLLLQIAFSPVHQQTTSLVPVHNHKQTEVHKRRQGVSDCVCCLLDYPLLLLLLILVHGNNIFALDSIARLLLQLRSSWHACILGFQFWSLG
ncbi:unnamed protein product [Sphagnum troendelagicum]